MPNRPRSFVRDHGLSLVLLALFAATFLAQTLTGHRVYNDERAEYGDPPVSLGAYLTTGHFGEATFENWESEFLQMAAYVLLTVFLYQRGSAESKDPDGEEAVDEDPTAHASDPDAPAPVRAGGWRLGLYRHSLSLTMAALFLASFAGHAVTGRAEFNEERAAHGDPPVSLGAFVGDAEFWFQSFQNWQSEFLAVLAIVVLTIRLRQQGSPESKPVFAPHDQTGSA